MATRRGGRSCCRRHLHQLLAYLSMLNISRATDTLRQGDSIRDGQTLVSAGGVFELGFFSGGAWGQYSYVGIWYKDTRDMVWVANRERPIANTSGVLTVDSSGSLMLLDGSTGRSVQVLVPGSGANTSTVATLQDSGNLLFQRMPHPEIPNSTEPSSRVVLWQSFDYPTNTWLPGMRLGKKTKGGLNRQLTSWRSPSDPSPGDFVFGADPEGPRLFVSQRGAVSWSSGVWNGQFFNNLTDLWFFFASLGKLSYHSSDSKTGEAYFEYSSAGAGLTRFVMEAGGQVRLSTRELWDRTWTWTALWAAPVRRQCEIPGYCGANGLCNGAATPACRCLYGFEPYAPARWASGDWSGGCLRRSPLSCGDGDRFLGLQNVEQPPAFRLNNAGDRSNAEAVSCKARCLAKCGCTAYADSNSNGCLMWFGQLLGLRETTEYEGGSIYVRLAASDLVETSDGRRKRLLLVTLPIVSGMALFGLFCCFLWTKRKGVYGATDERLVLRDIGIDRAVAYKFVNVSENGGERGPEIYLYSFSNILTATDNFSDANKLGEGGFGPVYKGKLPDGQEIAIKRLSTRSGQGLEEFKNEILLIARLQHKNLVRLLGCCIQGEERLLVYEYMPNKSLDFFLFDPNRAAQLDWGRRVQIIEGITQGLLYLHKYSRLTIIHRDLKASNILLDNEMNPKISDFGLARIFSSNEPQANTNRIVGTFGYMPPEYAMEGLFSVKSDVFSFGVLLLEIVSSKKNVGSHHHLPGPRSLLGYAWELWKAGRELELMDPALGCSCPVPQVSRCIYIGLMCVQEQAVDRPTMADVVAMLASESSAHQVPKPPAFFTENHTTQESPSADFAASSSTNDVTISAIEGR